MSIKNVAILGSTGSIGINTLKVVERFPEKFRVVALTAYNNARLLEEQIRKFSPLYAAVDPKGIDYLKRHNNSKKIKLYNAVTQIAEIASLPDVDIVVLAIKGSAALTPFLSAIRSSKRIAPANKEALVVAGHILMPEAKKHNATIIPIDSEQSAIFQCLEGKRHDELKKIYLTASGGPLCNVAQKKFNRLSVREILKHPRWKMGKKITVDSATLMNKGFEVMEARWLFDVDLKAIEVLIHPQAVIHSMVEFLDGSILAQLGITDMRLPIQYALTYPRRLKAPLEPIDFFKLGQLSFKKPDVKKFPALALAFHAAQRGGTCPSVLNAANEEAVDAFLAGQIGFTKIYKIAEHIVVSHKVEKTAGLKEIQQADKWAREEAQKLISTNLN